MHVLGCLLVFLLWGLFLLVGIGLHVLRTISGFFGIGPKHTDTSTRNQKQQPHATAQPKRKKKVFTDDVGEYVDYEEV